MSLSNKKNKNIQKGGALLIKVSKTNENGPLVAEQMFSALHGILKKSGFYSHHHKNQEQISFEIAATSSSIKFYIWTPDELMDFVEGQIYAQYPDVEITKLENDYINTPYKIKSHCCGELTLSKHYVFPIKRFDEFEDKIVRVNLDSLSSITESMRKSVQNDHEQIWIQIVTKPIKDYWWQKVSDSTIDILTKNKQIFLFRFMGSETIIQSDIKWYFRLLLIPVYPIIWILNSISSLFTSTSASVIDSATVMDDDTNGGRMVKTTEYNTFACKAIVEKSAKPAFQTAIRIMYTSGDEVPKEISRRKIRAVVASFKQFYSASLNGFSDEISFSIQKLYDYYYRRLNKAKQFLNTEELATIFHLPNVMVQTPGILWVSSKKLEPPSNIPTFKNSQQDDLTLIGAVNFRGNQEEFGILPDDRRRHIYIIGKTGMGKSTLLENMIFSDLRAGKGLAVVDPHGELADAAIEYVPQERAEDLIICDPSDIAFPVSINMLEDPGTSEARSLIASGLVSVFKKMFAESWGPRLEHVLRNTILALTEYPDSNMLGIMRILVDEEYRAKVVANVTDPVVRSFWVGEFANYAPRNVAEIISPIQNKVGQFLSSPIVRNIVGQNKSTIRVREAMDSGKILIVNLSKGKLGEDNSALLGSMIITKIQLDAMSRSDIAADKRRDFYLYVDEFQNFATDSFATILSEARKYKLNLTIANQYIAQMSDIVRDAVFGNVGSIITFQTGYDDAEYLSTQFSEVVTPEDITSLNKYTIYSKLLVGGMPTKPFSANTLPPPDMNVSPELTKYFIDLSRYKYSEKRKSVEDAINKWSEQIISSGKETGAKKHEKKAPSFDIEKLKVGEKIKTNVVGKCDYGLFLSFQGIEGLLHISKVPKEKRKEIVDMEKGALIEVNILEIKNNKLAFSLLPVDVVKSMEKEVEKESKKLQKEIKESKKKENTSDNI